MRKIGFFSAAMLGLWMTDVSAQTACPAGVPPGDPRCGPSPSWHPGQQSQEQEEAPAVVFLDRYQVWDARWGALARDVQGPLGVAEQQTSRASAIEMAQESCLALGGNPERCTNVILVYRNSCAAYAWGDGYASWGAEPEIAVAEKAAVDGCIKAGGKSCEVVYSGCSLPQERWTYERPKDFKPAD